MPTSPHKIIHTIEPFSRTLHALVPHSHLYDLHITACSPPTKGETELYPQTSSSCSESSSSDSSILMASWRSRSAFAWRCFDLKAAAFHIVEKLIEERRRPTGGELCADKPIPVSTMFVRNHITNITERASTLRKKRLPRAAFLMSTLYAIMIKPCDMKNNSIAASTVCCGH